MHHEETFNRAPIQGRTASVRVRSTSRLEHLHMLLDTTGDGLSKFRTFLPNFPNGNFRRSQRR